MAVRLENYLFRSDVGTYKEILELIENGNVRVNGVVQKDNNFKVDAASDFVDVNGKLLNYRKYVYIIANKPEGHSGKPNDREHKTIMEILPDWCTRRKMKPVNSLDINMSGLMLITDDDGYYHYHNSYKKQRTHVYHVQTNKPVTIEHVEAFASGMKMKHFTGEIATLSKTDSYYRDEYAARITAREVSYLDIKKMMNTLGIVVLSVELIAIDDLVLPLEMNEGQWRELNGDEMALLRIANPYS
ncbi:MAG: S4 domain-containing protein [Eubacteriales bacterium]